MATKNIKLKGFTIIELLVVIVVIGILAAITIVSFANVSSRGKTASLATTANNLLQKAILYKQNNSSGNFAYNYPPTVATLTSLASSDPAYLTGVQSLAATPTTGNTTSPSNNQVDYEICGYNTNTTVTANVSAAPSALAGAANTTLYTASSAAIQSGAVLTGIQVKYYDFANSNVATISEGKVSGSDTVGSTQWTIACFPAP